MRRSSWLSTMIVCLALGSVGSGCGDSNDNGDGGHGLGDGHVQQGCAIDPDCDDGQKCHIGKCNIVTHMCMFTDKQCPAGDSCNVGTCDESSGECGMMAANDGADCTTLQGTAGNCTVGYCQPVPSCWDPQNSFGQLSCSTFGSGNSGNNDPFNVGFGVTNALTAYGNCATGEVAPEQAFQFFNSSTTDQVVTVHLQLDQSGGFGGFDAGVPDMATPDPDLDLIVIEGANCVGTAACLNPARVGGGFQGITAGTSDETVTFTAKASTQYYLVVDGKGSAYFKIELEACGKCQPTAATTLSCNMSMSLAGNTAMGSGDLGSYTCLNSGGSGTTMLAGAGKEQVFFYESAAPVVQKVKATVTGASADVTLAAIPIGATNECSPSACVAGATSTGSAPNKTASITFDAAVNDPFSPNRYFVVVDSQTAGNETAFGLQFSCMPYCAQDLTLTCTNGTAAANSNNANGQGHSVSAWGPAGAPCGGLSNLSGTEYVYLFTKPTTTKPTLRFTLVSATPNKHLGLIVLDAGTAGGGACDPTSTCASTTAVTVPADATTLASTGTYVADGPSSASANDAKTAVLDLPVVAATHYYWVVVDGVNGDSADFAVSVSNCQ